MSIYSSAIAKPSGKKIEAHDNESRQPYRRWRHLDDAGVNQQTHAGMKNKMTSVVCHRHPCLLVLPSFQPQLVPAASLRSKKKLPNGFEGLGLVFPDLRPPFVASGVVCG